MALLWIMRQLCDPYLKVSVSSCPCRSPSLHYSLLHYRWWPWQHLIANNIHLNKPFHAVEILTNFISFEKRCTNLPVKGGNFIFILLKTKVTQYKKILDAKCFRPEKRHQLRKKKNIDLKGGIVRLITILTWWDCKQSHTHSESSDYQV